MRKKSFIRAVLLTAVILLVPLIAMQFTDEVGWSLSDFVVFGTLVLSFRIAYEFLMVRFDSKTYQIIAGVIVLFIFLLIWAELGVGIFGTPWAGS